MRLWWENMRSAYGDLRMLVLLALGFSSGLPRLLVYSTLTFWLLDVGLSISAVGLFAATSLPYTFKFAWAPLMDGGRLPSFLEGMGRRRAWMLVTQVGLLASIASLAWTRPDIDPWWTAVAAIVVAAFSASQDIVIDAYRVDLLEDEEQGAGAAVAVLGYRLGMLVAGAGALSMATLTKDWTAVYLAMAACMGVGVVASVFAPRPPVRGESAASVGLWEAVRGPFQDMFRRPGVWTILAFVVLYKFGDALAGTMLNPFLYTVGFTKLEIAGVAKTYGLGASIGGVFLGGWLVKHVGVLRALWIAGFMQMFSNLVFVLQAWVGHDVWMLVATVGVENLCGGMGTAAFVAYLSSLCKREYTATQYALLTALSGVLRTLFSTVSGLAAEELGWMLYFGVTFASALPGMLLLVVLSQRDEDLA